MAAYPSSPSCRSGSCKDRDRLMSDIGMFRRSRKHPSRKCGVVGQFEFAKPSRLVPNGSEIETWFCLDSYQSASSTRFQGPSLS